MYYRDPTDDELRFFNRHGYLVVEQVIDPEEIDQLEAWGQEVLERKEELAKDWAWSEGESREKRTFYIVQAKLTPLFPAIEQLPMRQWATRFAGALMGEPMAFWYDQFLAKPPGIGKPTPWHQDEAYWGRNLDDKGITCWLPFHDVGDERGCMHFADGGHKLGILPHHQPPGVKSDLITCPVDEAASPDICCPLRRGSVTFHHSKTPHRTGGNSTDQWRRTLAQHFKSPSVPGEGDHYLWRVKVDQTTGERHPPADRR